VNFLDLIKERQSCRSYDPSRPVEQEKLMRCIEALRLAPSACNAQPWKLVVVTDPELKKKVAEAAGTKWLGLNSFAKQPPVIVALVREDPNFTSKFGSVVKNKEYTLMDVGIAAEHFCLAAASEGLGTCMIGWFDEPTVKKILGIPKKKRAELIITLGYPSSGEIRTKVRKPVEDICSFNRY